MQNFKDKVAVITGAASGIGRGLAEWCAHEGMKLVLADVEEKALAQTELELKNAGATVLAMQTDVSKAGDVEALAQAALETFGAVHLLFNNAGVAGTAAPIWENTLADWEWVLNVNVWGTIHGIHTFVPIMLKQNTECHIVNTASIAGLISGPSLGVYKVSKHSVVSLSETLSCDLAEIGAKIGVSVLCPVWVKTNIMHSERNRPVELQNKGLDKPMSREIRGMVLSMTRAVRDGLSPKEVAEKVFDAIRNEKFYILTHPESKSEVQKRMEDILEGRNPSQGSANTNE